MIDLTKLTPAPWKVSENEPATILDGNGKAIAVFFNGQNPEDPCKARNAFDIMLSRRVFPVPVYLGWSVYGIDTEKRIRPWLVGFKGFSAMPWPDPYTALVEADAWYRKHIEKEEGKS